MNSRGFIPDSLSEERFLRLIKKYEKLFTWVRWFYPKAVGVPIHFMLYCFVPQKIFRINGGVGWPVHFTSRILYHRRIRVGNNCPIGMAGGCYIQARNGIQVGNNLWTGPGVGLISANHDLDDYHQHVSDRPIEIGDNVWLGMNAVVLPGVCIGDNVAVGANSVVNRDLPANTIAAGNPCRPIKAKAQYRGFDFALI